MQKSPPGSVWSTPWVAGFQTAIGIASVDLVLVVLLAQADMNGDLDWAVSIDSTINRDHQHATNTRKPENATGGSVESQRPGQSTQ